MIDDVDSNIEVLLVGGVTHSPFFSNMVQQHFKSWDGVTIPGSVEDFLRPLVPIGCILCVGQPAIGRRFRVKEAYGIPIAQPFEPEIHSPGSRIQREDASNGHEVRDLIGWLRKVGEFSTERIVIYDWSVTLFNDDNTPYTRDPRNDPSLYPLVIKQGIFGTTDTDWGKRQHFPYKDVSEVKLRKVCEISLTQEECSQITGKDVGFYRHSRTGQWSFRIPVRTTLQWLDVRASWTAEIPKSGHFTGSPYQAVWSKEIRFASIEHHGHKAGDELMDEGTDGEAEDDTVVVRPRRPAAQ